jgi:hypothetical protein
VRLVVPLLAVLGGAAGVLFGGAPSVQLRAGRRYRATFVAPPALRTALTALDTRAVDTLRNLKGLFPGGAAIAVSDDRTLVIATFIAPRDGELDDATTPLKGDVQTPLGPLVLRKLEEIKS